MFRYACKLLLSSIPVVFITITICFFMLRLAPGGPFGGENHFDTQTLENLNKVYHFDQPLYWQYFFYLKNVLTGDLGPSTQFNGFDVYGILAKGLPYSVTLGLMAFFVAVVLGCFSGLIASLYVNSWSDYLVSAIVLIGVVVPTFLTGAVFRLIFGVKLKWVDLGGLDISRPSSFVLPVLILSWPAVAKVSQLFRAAMLDVLGQNYIRTARAKGLGSFMVIFKHAVKPSLIPVVSYLGPLAGGLLTGSIIVENLFGLPGIGRYFISGAINRDYGLVLGTVILYIVLIVILNLIVDLVYAFLDPKVTY